MPILPDVLRRSLAALALLLLFAPAAMAWASPGAWCTAALESLQGKRLDHAGIALHLLARQSPPAIEIAPRRIVHVSARATRAGDGSAERPYRSPQVAVDKARPGDRILVGPGRYEPVLIRTSGTPQAPIHLAAQSDATGRAVIDGTGTWARGLIAIRGASNVTVSGFRLQNAPQDGVFVEGTLGGERNIRILDNDIDTTGNAGIFVAGIVMRYITRVDEYRLFNVLVQGNRITRTNEPNGVNEAISLGAGVNGFVIRNNHVFDTRQYGIDVKAGAINGAITENVIHGIADHGIYLDAGSRRVANVNVRRNAVFGARNGIVLARESRRDPENPNLHDIKVVDNLVFDSPEFGIMAYRHRIDSGRGRFDEVVIARNCLCDIARDGIRMGGIGPFSSGFWVDGNLILSSGGEVWNRIGAAEGRNGALRGDLKCPA